MPPDLPLVDIMTSLPSDVPGRQPQSDVASRDELHGETRSTHAAEIPLGGDAKENAHAGNPADAGLIAQAPERAPPLDQSEVGHEPLSSPPELVRTSRTEPVASEPIVERVVVRPDAGAESAVEAPKPARKGWWQRRFGSE
jgi:hypothetical protein